MQTDPYFYFAQAQFRCVPGFRIEDVGPIEKQPVKVDVGMLRRATFGELGLPPNATFVDGTSLWDKLIAVAIWTEDTADGVVLLCGELEIHLTKRE